MKHRVNLLINEYEIRDENKIKPPFQSCSPYLFQEVVGFFPCNCQHFVPFVFQCSQNWKFHHCISENEMKFILCTKLLSVQYLNQISFGYASTNDILYSLFCRNSSTLQH